jgi:hypothetical protein
VVKNPWPGRVLTALPVLFLAFDVTIKLMNIQPVIDSFTQLGVPIGLTRVVGTVELVCLVAYCLPRTAVLGAILLTGYLGGAVLTHLRVGDPLLSHTLFPVYIGMMLWGALWLRDPRVRALLPLRS